jgi:hypothetical protein
MSYSGTTTSSSSSTWFVPVLCEGLYLFVVSDCIYQCACVQSASHCCDLAEHLSCRMTTWC